jgi:hypothetical protein
LGVREEGGAACEVVELDELKGRIPTLQHCRSSFLSLVYAHTAAMMEGRSF